MEALPDVLREGRVLSAIYRVGPSEPRPVPFRLRASPARRSRALANAMRKSETRSIA